MDGKSCQRLECDGRRDEERQGGMERGMVNKLEVVSIDRRSLSLHFDSEPEVDGNLCR